MDENNLPLEFWEQCWAAYDSHTYQKAATYIQTTDVVLDIGAGDLRFARHIAASTRHIYAIELQHDLVTPGTIPPNVTMLYGDARHLPFPNGITTAVLLMRHCTHFALYVTKLRQIGCQRLITNARWGTGVECIELSSKPPLTYYCQQSYAGWYACLCGQVGFYAISTAAINEHTLQQVLDVEGCPYCQHTFLESDDSCDWNRDRLT